MEELKSSNIMQALIFEIGGEEYGIDIKDISSIIENNLPITRVPGAPVYVIGVINLRGDIIPILELSSKFNFPAIKETKDTKIIILNIDDMNVGIKIDRVMEVMQFDSESIEELSSEEYEKSGEYSIGLIRFEERDIILIDAEKLIKK